jgi:hypothetical protein
MSFQVRAIDLARAFELQTRDDGSTYYTIREGSPEWMTEAVRAAHDDEFPNDWRFRICNFLAQGIAEYETADDAYDNQSIIAEAQDAIYTSDLLAWYAERPSRLDYADQAEEELGRDPGASIGDRLHLGHHYAIEQMAQVLISACEVRAQQMQEVTA